MCNGLPNHNGNASWGSSYLCAQEIEMESRKIAELFGIDAPAQAVMQVSDPSFDTPDIDEAYVFQPDQVRKLQTWWNGKVKKSLFLTGPTGCGKTTLIEQFAARIGADVFVVPCHGKLDMSELIGQIGIARDGSTFFDYGTGVKAMKHNRPCILLLDEMNFVPPSSVGLLNRITELKSFTITETGEIVRPMPWLRIAATGNAVERGDDSARYRGTQAMNVALLNRFLGMRVGYMDALAEASMLNKAVPGLHSRLIEKLVELANEVRVGFDQGNLEVVMSTRTLIDMGQALFFRKSFVEKDPVAEVSWAMEFCLTDLARPEDRDTISGLINAKLSGLKLSNDAGDESPLAGAFSPKVQTHPAKSGVFNAWMNLWIHPNRGVQGATFWGYVEMVSRVRHTFNGNVEEASPRDGRPRDAAYLNSMRKSKEAKGYIYISVLCPLVIGRQTPSVEEVLEAVKPIMEIVRDCRKGLIPLVSTGPAQQFFAVAAGI
jgi:cobaltochelatase CobS